MIYQLRMLIAEKLLGWAVAIAPKNGEDALNLLKHIEAYMESAQKFTERS